MIRIHPLALAACMLAMTSASAMAQQVHVLAPGQRLALQGLSDDQVLQTSTGRRITVGQYKAAIARVVATGAQPAVVRATPTMTIASAARLPAGTVVTSSSGAAASVATLAHIQQIRERAAARKVEPVLPAAVLGTPVGEVGKTLTLAQALARNDSDTVTVGTQRVTVGQLRYIDAHLKAAGRPSLEQRLASRTASTTTAPKVVKVARGTDLKSLRGLPPDTILESPGGKRTNVATLNAYYGTPALQAEMQKRQPARATTPQPAIKP